MTTITKEHIEAVERAAERAKASEAQWESVAVACAVIDGKRYYEAVKHAADAMDDAARLAEVAAFLRSSGWRPIESAPKDGTNIDLWVVYTDTPSKGHRVCDSFCDDGQWFDQAENWGEGGYLDEAVYKPTHWQPLPAPPTVGE